MKRKFFAVLLLMAFMIGAAASVYATSGYLSSWKSAYPASASSTFSCSLCHTSAPALNGYGQAALNASLNYKSIESQDSDGDGATNIVEINAGTNPGSSSSKPPTAAACTGYTYSSWSACTNGQQTRTVTGNTPAGCTGAPSAAPVLTQTCTPAPVACTDYTYSSWSVCTNDQQTRTVTGNIPAGCTGTPSAAPVLTQTCTSSPTACTSFTYGSWTACDETGHQTRTAVGVPAGCTGTPDPAQLTQVCDYTPPVVTPPPAGDQTMPVPTGEDVYSYAPVDQPVVSSDPSQAKPIGVGPVAAGGNTIDVKVNAGPFAGAVDVSFVIYAPALDSDDLYFMNRSGELKRLSRAVDDDEHSVRLAGDSHSGDNDEHDHDSRPSRKFGRLITWKDSNVTGVNEDIFAGQISELPSGVYTLVLVARSHEDDDNYYRWITHITIP